MVQQVGRAVPVGVVVIFYDRDGDLHLILGGAVQCVVGCRDGGVGGLLLRGYRLAADEDLAHAQLGGGADHVVVGGVGRGAVVGGDGHVVEGGVADVERGEGQRHRITGVDLVDGGGERRPQGGVEDVGGDGGGVGYHAAQRVGAGGGEGHGVGVGPRRDRVGGLQVDGLTGLDRPRPFRAVGQREGDVEGGVAGVGEGDRVDQGVSLMRLGRAGGFDLQAGPEHREGMGGLGLGDGAQVGLGAGGDGGIFNGIPRVLGDGVGDLAGGCLARLDRPQRANRPSQQRIVHCDPAQGDVAGVGDREGVGDGVAHVGHRGADLFQGQGGFGVDVAQPGVADIAGAHRDRLGDASGGVPALLEGFLHEVVAGGDLRRVPVGVGAEDHGAVLAGRPLHTDHEGAVLSVELELPALEGGLPLAGRAVGVVILEGVADDHR